MNALSRSGSVQPDLSRSRIPAKPARVPPVAAAVSAKAPMANARTARASYVAPNQWWRPERLEAALGENRWLDSWFHWKIPGRPPPACRRGSEWTSRKRRGIEYCFWLYELSARLRGMEAKALRPNYIFGAAVADLGHDAVERQIAADQGSDPVDEQRAYFLTEIQRVGHGLKGCLDKISTMVREAPGSAVAVLGDLNGDGPYPPEVLCSWGPEILWWEQDGSVYELPSFEPWHPHVPLCEMLPWTPWKSISDGRKKERLSLRPVSINLECSDDSIATGLRHRAADIGFMVSRNQGRSIARKLRAASDWVGNSGEPVDGEHRRGVSWRTLEEIDQYFADARRADVVKPKDALKVARRHLEAVAAAEKAWTRDGAFLPRAELA